jgi:hypothetical protein
VRRRVSLTPALERSNHCVIRGRLDPSARKNSRVVGLGREI